MFNKKSAITAVVTGLAGLMLTANASAADNGIYLGGSIGWGDIYQSDITNAINGTHSDKTAGLAGRVYEGFQINENFAVEAGYTKFHDVDLRSDLSDDKFKLKSYAVDVVGKGTIPLQNGIALFGKVGAAYLNEAFDFQSIYQGQINNTTESVSKVLPTYGAGVSYEINKNVVADVSWMRIQAVGNTDLKSTDTAMLGLSYHF